MTEPTEEPPPFDPTERDPDAEALADGVDLITFEAAYAVMRWLRAHGWERRENPDETPLAESDDSG